MRYFVSYVRHLTKVEIPFLSLPIRAAGSNEKVATPGAASSLSSKNAASIHLYCRGGATLRVDFYVPFGLFNEAVNLAQTQTSSFFYTLGGEKRIECTSDHSWRHSNACITDGDHYELAGLDFRILLAVRLIQISIASFDGHLAALRHSVARSNRDV
jgi:hypothetical protein